MLVKKQRKTELIITIDYDFNKEKMIAKMIEDRVCNWEKCSFMKHVMKEEERYDREWEYSGVK